MKFTFNDKKMASSPRTYAEKKCEVLGILPDNNAPADPPRTIAEKKCDVFGVYEADNVATDALRAYAEKKVSKIDRLFRTESEANVTFSTERGRFTAEITIKNNGTFFRAHETTSDMYASVDSAVATIERQIRKNKTRLAKKLRVGAFEREVQPDFLPADDAAEAGAFEVVRRKRFPIKPMSVEEAILQMDLLEHTFFVFRDVASDGAVAVVYRRKNGGYGLISDAAE